MACRVFDNNVDFVCTATSHETAERIVRSVNSHAALVAVCKDYLPVLMEMENALEVEYKLAIAPMIVGEEDSEKIDELNSLLNSARSKISEIDAIISEAEGRE